MFTGLVNWMLSVVNFVLDWTVIMFTWLVNYALWKTIEWLWFMLRPLYQRLIDYLPDIPAYDLSLLGKAFTVGDHWMPLTEAIDMVVAYWAFVAIFVAVKLLLKAIPTVG